MRKTNNIGKVRCQKIEKGRLGVKLSLLNRLALRQLVAACFWAVSGLAVAGWVGSVGLVESGVWGRGTTPGLSFSSFEGSQLSSRNGLCVCHSRKSVACP